MLMKWLKDNGFLAADAKEDAVDAAVEAAFKAGKLTAGQYKSLLAEKSPEQKIADDRAAFAKMITDGVAGAVVEAVKSLKPEAPKVEAPKVEETPDVEKLVKDAVAAALKAQQPKEEHLGKKIFSLASTIGNAEHPDTVRIKSAAERFTDVKTQRTYTKGFRAGQPMTLECRGHKAVDLPSQLDNALSHAWFKFQVAPESLTDHDKSLLVYAVEHKEFVGQDAFSTDARRLNGDEIAYLKHAINNGIGQKANMLDDTTSGGQYAVPEFFDTNAILVPLNDGELTPFVNIIEVPRGHSVVSYSMGLPTVTKVAEGTAQTIFDATGLVGQFTCSFFPAQCFIEIGRDFLSDAVPRFGQDIMTQMGRAFGAWADEQIVTGDGTTEPQGIFNASSTTTVISTNGSGGPVDISDLVNLQAAVDKAHFNNYDRSRCRYIMTNAEYYAFRRLSTGISQDDRLLFGDNMKEYNLLMFGVSTPYAGLTNSQIAFAQLGGYRWYRRQGVVYGTETAGATLVRSNTNLVYGRTRNGGKLERGQYAAVMTDAAS